MAKKDTEKKDVKKKESEEKRDFVIFTNKEDQTGNESDLWFWGEDWLENEEGGINLAGALAAASAGGFPLLKSSKKKKSAND